MSVNHPTLGTGGRAVTVSILAAVLVAFAPAVAPAAPDRSVPAGAQIPAGTFAFADMNAGACTHHISLAGSDASTGASPSAAWRNPAKAFAELTAGQSACVHAGTYDVGMLDPRFPGTGSAPITLRGTPGEARPVLRSTSDGPMVNFGSRDAYWILQGLDLTKNRRNGPTVQVLGTTPSANPADGPAHHLAIRDGVIRESMAGAAVLIRHAATDVLIQNNEIRDHHRWQSGSLVAYSRLNTSYRRADANAVNLEGTATGTVARIQVSGNHMHDNGGDGLQCLGVDDNAGAHSHDPANLDMVDNRIDHNAEDAIDIKSCQGVSIRGSRSPVLTGSAAGNKLYGFRPTDKTADMPGNTSGGGAIVVHYFARRVLIENTRIWDACRGISIGRADKFGVQDVVIRRTLIFGLVTSTDCPGLAVNLTLAQRVDIYHNTFTGIPGVALRLASDNGGQWSSTDVDVFENIVDTASSGTWLDVYRPRLSDFESDRNLFWAPDGSPAHMRLDFNTVALSSWRASTGQDAASRHGDPMWVDQPAQNDYYTRLGSPARDAAAVAAGETYCGTAPDIGFRESGC